MKQYPIGIQDFESLRKDGFFYLDKTRHIYNMAHRGCYYFLNRPRRFGKSLLISTMEAYFSGKRELFGGLEMERLEKEWKCYPVLHLDLNTAKYETEEILGVTLGKALDGWEDEYGVTSKYKEPEFRFSDIVRHAAERTGERVVILIDEYDKPLLQTIDNDALYEKYRNTLRAFYSVLKTQDRYIRFAFLTGVTKFGKVSVFSDLNNLMDISMDERYIDICGMTETEIRTNFDEDVERLAGKCGMTVDECYAKLKLMYDGYHFEHDTVGIYNPFSLLNTFEQMKFGNYWAETGTPTFLVKLLQRNHYPLAQMTEDVLTSDLLNCIDTDSYYPLPVIYQSGYLTIKDYNEEFRTYTLDFPNKEVKDGFIRFLMPFYTPANPGRSEYFIQNFVRDIRSGDVDSFMQRMQTLFVSGDYRVAGNAELYFQNAMYIIFRLIGFYVEVERPTSNGRMDILVKTPDYIYIMELKLDGSAEEALRQIEERGYAQPYALDGRRIFRIGVNFSSKTRGMTEWKME